MKYEYRIKVEECNNGKKYYIPQIGEPKLTFCKRSVYPWLDWDNLYPELIPKYTYDPDTQLPISKEEIIDSVERKKGWVIRFDTEKEANDVIEFYKKEMERTEGNKVKNVYFIKK